MVKFWGHVSRPSRALQARDHFGPRQLKGINERIVLPHNLTFKGYISTLNQPEVVIIVNFETFTYWFLYFWCFFFTRMTKNPVGKGVNPIEYQDIVKIGQFCLLILIKVIPLFTKMFYGKVLSTKYWFVLKIYSILRRRNIIFTVPDRNHLANFKKNCQNMASINKKTYVNTKFGDSKSS